MKSMLAVPLIAALVFTLGCDGAKNLPTAPTASPEPVPAGPATSPAPVSGATISGVLKSSAAAAGFGPGAFASSITVQVVGTGVSAPVDAAGNFELKGVPAADVVLRFSGGGLDASVSLGTVQSGQSIQVTISITGSVGVVNGDSRLTHGESRELEGTIEALQAPNQIVVKSRLVEIVATTKIKRGSQLLTYADLAVGHRVHVRGATSVASAGTVLTAEVIELQTGDPHDDKEAELKGVVDAPYPAGGSCSALPLSFTVAGKLVTADASTAFRPSCSALAAGVKVEVEGLLQSDGSLLAKKVEVENVEKEIEGLVGSPYPASGSCSALPLTFTVGTTVVTVTASTAVKPSCSTLAAGMKVEVEGLLQLDGSLLAKKVEVEGVEKEIEGLVGSPYPASGSCSALPLTFTVGTTVVTVTASTAVKPSCSTLAAGMKVEVEGLLQLDGSLLAKKVEVEGVEKEIEGLVGSPYPASGSCSALPLTFTVGTMVVKAATSTVFSPSCGTLAAGMKVAVEGLLQPDGSLLARKILVLGDGSAKLEYFSGAVTALTGGSCGAQNLAFDVSVSSFETGVHTRRVKTTSSTLFVMACADIKAGVKLSVEGRVQSGSSLVEATKVK